MRKNYGNKQQQIGINLQAHDRVLAFENFYYLMEGLEEYIEKSRCLPNFRRQFKNITVPKEKTYSSDNCENLFRTRLLLFVGILDENTPEDTREAVKDEFNKWIGMVGIDANNCPNKLKHFLFEVNNVIEGKGEKIVEQTKSYLNEKQRNSNLGDMDDVVKVFNYIQNPLEKKREDAELYRNRNYFEVNVESRLDEGSSDAGRLAFDRISRDVSNHHNNFNFYQNQSSNNDYDLALWKWNNWTEEDYRNNGETREGLQKWIIKLEAKQKQAQIEQPPAYDWSFLS